MQTRITNKVIEIDDGSVRHFFENRAKKQLPHRYNYSIYQDDDPELALQRDSYEKEFILNKIEVKNGMKILDIGCGVGRWADAFVDYNIDIYVGVDICSDFLDIARESLSQHKKKFIFIESSFSDVLENIIKNDLPKQYDLILINGVLLYINDSEIEKCLELTKALLGEGGTIYIKDAIGIDNRLTLNDFKSEELKENYSAIYRTLNEWNEWMGSVFYNSDFKISCGSIWPNEMRNRAETEQYYWIITRR